MLMQGIVLTLFWQPDESMNRMKPMTKSTPVTLFCLLGGGVSMYLLVVLNIIPDGMSGIKGLAANGRNWPLNGREKGAGEGQLGALARFSACQLRF